MGLVYNKEHKTYHMHHQTEIKTVRGKTGFLKFIRKLEFQITKFGNRNFEKYFKEGILNK